MIRQRKFEHRSRIPLECCVDPGLALPMKLSRTQHLLPLEQREDVISIVILESAVSVMDIPGQASKGTRGQAFDCVAYFLLHQLRAADPHQRGVKRNLTDPHMVQTFHLAVGLTLLEEKPHAIFGRKFPSGKPNLRHSGRVVQPSQSPSVSNFTPVGHNEGHPRSGSQTRRESCNLAPPCTRGMFDHSAQKHHPFLHVHTWGFQR